MQIATPVANFGAQAGLAAGSLSAAKATSAAGALTSPTGQALGAKPADERGELRDKFDTFVGEAFYGQMLSAMRKTTGKAAYFNGGRAEEVFRGQLDQVIAQRLTEANANSFTGPMFDLFALQRK